MNFVLRVYACWGDWDTETDLEPHENQTGFRNPLSPGPLSSSYISPWRGHNVYQNPSRLWVCSIEPYVPKADRAKDGENPLFERLHHQPSCTPTRVGRLSDCLLFGSRTRTLHYQAKICDIDQLTIKTLMLSDTMLTSSFPSSRTGLDDEQVPANERQPLLQNQTSMSSQKLPPWRQYLTANVSRNWAETVLLLCYFITGLLDSASISVWSSFVSMQTGN